MRGEPDHDQHAADRRFLKWLREALPSDLRAKYHELCDIAWRGDLWKCYAILRELERRGEPLP